VLDEDSGGVERQMPVVTVNGRSVTMRPTSAQAALAGATVLANLSGSPITIGRAEDRKLLARSASAR